MENGVLIQFFHWYSREDGTLWKYLATEAPKLASLGITAAWLPPACKGADGIKSRGYDSYDLYDLGEFDQKGTVRTRYGTREEYLDCIKSLQANGISVIVDVVINHKAGADEKETFLARKVDPDNRNAFISDAYEIEGATKFTFPGRKGQYSSFIWDHSCFSGIDYDFHTNEQAIFRIQSETGEGWDEVVDVEKGNFDYLMCADIDHRNPAVQEELIRWAHWYFETAGFNGIRLDGIKHMNPAFINAFIDALKSRCPDLFVVGEYWTAGDLPLLQKYLDATQNRMSLFDASLHQNIFEASEKGSAYDLRKIFDSSLVAHEPMTAVTLIDNHDTQPMQTLEAPVAAWFKPLAYSLILLREKGYPCVFYPDLYGTSYTDNEQTITLAKCDALEALLKARKTYASGMQRDYFDDANCVGWTREGTDNPSAGCAVIMSTAGDAAKYMEMGKKFAGKTVIDHLGVCGEEIKIDANGWAEFRTKGGKVSVWVLKE